MFDKIFELFDARYDIAPSHTKSIQICKINKISMPENAQISIASEINLNPIVNHQIIKNGFNALSRIPETRGPCFRFVVDSLFLKIVLICIAANTKSVIAPKTDMIVLNSGNNSSENTPIPNRMTSGNSTIVWPIAILIPDLAPPLSPCAMFAANSGPGAITPDAEITITKTENSSN